MFGAYGNFHDSHRAGGGGDQRNHNNIISTPPFGADFNFLKAYVDQRLDAELRILRENFDQRLDAELRTVRELVDQRFKEVNKRIDELHAKVTGDKLGPAIYTDVTLQNMSDGHISLYDQHDWYGSAIYPQFIAPHSSGKIKHDADPKIGDSKGGVAYTIGNNIRWVVAWSNMKDKENKAYIDVIETEDKINWDVYQSLLETSRPKPDAVNKYWKRVVAHIEPSSTTPLMTATLTPAIR